MASYVSTDDDAFIAQSVESLFAAGETKKAMDEIVIEAAEADKETDQLKIFAATLVNSTNKSVPAAEKLLMLEELEKLREGVTKKKHSVAKKISKLSSAAATTKAEVLKVAKKSYRNKEVDRITKILVASQTVSLCFVMDATGSMQMGKLLNALKTRIRDIIKPFQDANVHFKFELGLVAYRDLSDPDHFELHPFSGSISQFEAKLASIDAHGGADIPEDVIGGLKEAQKFDWKYGNRLLFLCGDAPCHGVKYHTADIWDDYPDGVGNFTDVVKTLYEKKIKMVFFRANSSTDKMIDEFNKEAGVAIGNSNYIETFALDTNDLKVLESTIASSITESVSKSMEASASAAAKLTVKESTTLKSLPETILEDSIATDDTDDVDDREI